jgi:hypothetical protein
MVVHLVVDGVTAHESARVAALSRPFGQLRAIDPETDVVVAGVTWLEEQHT